jgi:O-methyltransferase
MKSSTIEDPRFAVAGKPSTWKPRTNALEKLLGSSLYFRLGIYAGKLAGTSGAFASEAALNHAMNYVYSCGIEGDYLEFGVWEGRVFSVACHLGKRRSSSMNFYAFDSFAGLPENNEADATGYEMYKPGTFNCSEPDFLNNVRRKGADLNRVVTVPGWFEESLKPDNPRLANLRKAAVVWVDCDLYASTVSVLSFLTQYLQPGSIVFFDDWFGFRGDPNAGEQRAFREWLEANPQFSATEMMRFSWHGNSFIIHNAAHI